ncbi:Uncharacterised protein [uncultured archaeon]|nr:Uncharacterised protein [uncultured archaeon]
MKITFYVIRMVNPCLIQIILNIHKSISNFVNEVSINSEYSLKYNYDDMCYISELLRNAEFNLYHAKRLTDGSVSAEDINRVIRKCFRYANYNLSLAQKRWDSLPYGHMEEPD